MNWLNDEDLKAHSFNQYINESAMDAPTVRVTVESNVISLIKSKLRARYDVAAIFNSTGLNRPQIIVMIASLLVVCKLIMRNKARKVPSDVEAAHKWALDWLDDVRNNIESPDLPLYEDEDGNEIKKARWGNSKNENWYL